MADFTVEQISEDNLLFQFADSVISDDSVYWSDSIFNISNRNTTNLEEINSEIPFTFYETIEDGYGVFKTQVNDGDDENEYFVTDGELITEIPELTDDSRTNFDIDDSYITWVRDSEFYAFNLIDNNLNQIVITDFSDSASFGSFSNSSFVDENNELNTSIFWERGSSSGIAFFNGIETIILSSTEEEVRETSNPDAMFSEDIIGTDEDNIVWERRNRRNGSTFNREFFLFDGTEVKLIQTLPTVDGFNSETGVAAIDEDNVVLITETTDDNGEVLNSTLNIGLYDGDENKIIYQYDSETNDVSDISIVDNRVVWVETSNNGEDPVNSLFLYNGNEVVQLAEVSEDFNFDSFDYQLSDRFVVWRDRAENGNPQQLFVYDGAETTQLTDPPSGSNASVDSFGILDDGIAWVVDDDAPDSSPGSNLLEVYLATTNEENTSQNDDVTTVPNGVYRFFNQDTGVHFYTGNEAERDAVLELPNFNFEGASYQSIDPITGNPEPSPVYRFLNQDTGVHLYTISEAERDATQQLDNFSFEGEAFFAYPTEVDGSIPIYRFFNTTSGAHFYTPSAVERDNVEDNLPDFQSEGIAYYALPIDG